MFGLIKNRKHENVGRTFYSPYYMSNITVVAFNSNDKWWFCFADTEGKTHYHEARAHTDFRYFVESGLEVT